MTNHNHLFIETADANAATNRSEHLLPHTTRAYSYSEIGAFFGLRFTTVGKVVRKAAQHELRG
jgi:hypothetical protein